MSSSDFHRNLEKQIVEFMNSNTQFYSEPDTKSYSEPNTIFCSEADFQFSLAWYLKEKLNNVNIILEYPYVADKQLTDNKEREKIYYIDIYVEDSNSDCCSYIELKYKTKSGKIKRYGKHIDLKNQAAQDIGRYLFLKDVLRLEEICEKENSQNMKNYAILLTNDSSYWTTRSNTKTLDTHFRIHDGKEINGVLKWEKRNADAAHWSDKYSPITLKNSYTCNWKVKSHEAKNWNYLIFSIPSAIK